jgi:hypothetical protein
MYGVEIMLCIFSISEVDKNEVISYFSYFNPRIHRTRSWVGPRTVITKW